MKMTSIPDDQIMSACLLNEKQALLAGLKGIYTLDTDNSKVEKVDEIAKQGFNQVINGNLISFEVADDTITKVSINSYL